MAVNDYSGPPYKVINIALLSGKTPPPPHDKTYKLVRSAFQKAKPFDEPVLVTRGLTFDLKEPIEVERMNELLAKFNSIVGTRQVMRLTCFNSTGTSGIPTLFQGNVLLSIYAKSGLDLMAYSKTAHERELLLDNETPVLCHSCLKQGDVWHVELEQVLEKKKK